MARKQRLLLSKGKSLMVFLDNELALTRMAGSSEQDLALINAYRKDASLFSFPLFLVV